MLSKNDQSNIVNCLRLDIFDILKREVGLAEDLIQFVYESIYNEEISEIDKISYIKEMLKEYCNETRFVLRSPIFLRKE